MATGGGKQPTFQTAHGAPPIYTPNLSNEMKLHLSERRINEQTLKYRGGGELAAGNFRRGIFRSGFISACSPEQS